MSAFEKCDKGIYITNDDLKYHWAMDIVYQDSTGLNYRTNISVRCNIDLSLEEIAIQRINTMIEYEKVKWVAILSIKKEE